MSSVPLPPSKEKKPSSSSESSGDEEKRTRGATRLPHLAKENNAKQKEVEYNTKNQAIGAYRVELTSLMGLEVRRSIGLRFQGKWPDVPQSEKENLWDVFRIHYKIHGNLKGKVIAACGRYIRDWKSKVAKKYIHPYEDNPKRLRQVPKKYPYIKQEDWDKFVQYRLSSEFKVKSEKYVRLRQKNKYPHRMGRMGYAGLEEKLIKDGTCNKDEPIDRSLLWKKARENKNGDFEGEDLQTVVKKIDDFSQKVNEGSISVEGKKDALTYALGTPEHDGRVRGAGKDVTPSEYFKTAPRRGSRSKAQDAEIQALRQKLHEQNAAMEKQKLDFEKQQLNFQKEMEEKLSLQMERIQKNIMSQVSKGTSASIASPPFEKDSPPSEKGTVRSSAGSPHPSIAHQSEPCKLALNSPSNVVALGNVFYSSGQQMIHSAPVPQNHCKVSIDVVFDSKALLPIPSDEGKTVKDAEGSYVSWPKHLVLPATNAEDESSVLDPFEQFYGEAEGVMIDGTTIEIEYDKYVFDQEEDGRLALLLEDVDIICHCKWVSNNDIMIYMIYQHEKMSEQDRNTYGFLNPMSIVGGKDPETNFVSVVKDKMHKAQQRYTFIPVNVGSHWILLVFIKETLEVYYFNPLKHGGQHGLQKLMTTASADLRAHGNKRRKTLNFLRKKNVPTQPGSWECGYYVMRYIKDIIEWRINIANADDMKSVFGKDHYSQSDIDEVRQEWVDYVKPYIS